MKNRILRAKQVTEAIGLSRTTLWRRVRDGQFPKPVKLGPTAIGWRSAEVEEWLDSRPEASAKLTQPRRNQ